MNTTLFQDIPVQWTEWMDRLAKRGVKPKVRSTRAVWSYGVFMALEVLFVAAVVYGTVCK